MKKIIMRELVGKDIRITDFRIEKFMNSKSDKAIVELEVDGEYCYFETTNPEVIRQLLCIKQCVTIYKLNKKAKNIVWVRRLVDSIRYNTNGDAYTVTEEFSKSESKNNRYLCFYKNSVYVKVVKQKTSIYFSFSPNISKETIDRLLTEEEKSHTKAN